MKTDRLDIRRIIAVTVFCIILGAVFCLPDTDQAYAAVQEQIYEPYETAVNGLHGKDVPVSKDYQAMIQYNISSGGTVYKGSGECWGYAEKIRRMFGSGGGRKTSVKKKATAKNMYKYLKKVRPGTHVRFGSSKSGSGWHSIALYKVTKDKIYFSDGNWDRANCIRHVEASIDYFSNFYILWYIQPTGGYKARTPQVAGYSYDLSNRIELSWRPVAKAKSYTVYKATSKKGKYKKLKTVKKPFFTDKNAKAGANYYKVKANNSSMSAVKVIYNKLKPPTVHVNATKQGYPKLTWNKVKGAKKYGIYEYAYSSKKGEYLKLLKTVKGTSYTFKRKTNETQTLYVRAIASNSKGNSAYNEVPVRRFAPKGKIFSCNYSETFKCYDFYCGVMYDPTVYDDLELHLLRSDKKNGEYEEIDYCVVYGTDSWGYGGQTTKEDFDYKTDSFLMTDRSWDYGKTYYYKVEATVGDKMWYPMNGLDSAIEKVTMPDISVTLEEEDFGGGKLATYADETLVYFIDANGREFTRNLRRDYINVLYYEDENGQGYMTYDSGETYYCRYDSETDTYYKGDKIGSEDTYEYDGYTYDESYSGLSEVPETSETEMTGPAEETAKETEPAEITEDAEDGSPAAEEAEPVGEDSLKEDVSTEPIETADAEVPAE